MSSPSAPCRFDGSQVPPKSLRSTSSTEFMDKEDFRGGLPSHSNRLRRVPEPLARETPPAVDDKNQKRNLVAKILCYQESQFAGKRLPKHYTRESLREMTVSQLETIHETNYDCCSSSTVSLLSNKILIVGAVMAEQIPSKLGTQKFNGLARNIIDDPEIKQLWELITIEHLD